MQTPTLLLEQDFAAQLNIDREIVAEVRARALAEGEHYHRNTAGAVLLTEAGIDALLAALGEAGGHGKPRLQEPPAMASTVLVVMKTVPNPRQVLCRLETDEKDPPELLVLKVPTARENDREINYFARGMRVLGRPEKGAIWTYTGPRPRYRGDVQLLRVLPPAAPAKEASQEQR
jgi:hypothetical protein